MAHELGARDRLGLSLQPAWHGLGKIFSKPMTTEEVLKETSVGHYNVLQTRGWIPYNPNTGKVWIPEKGEIHPPKNIAWMQTEAMFNLRDDVELPDPDALLSPTGVGEGYEIVQNAQLCEIADRVMSESGARYETAGTLRNGKLVWLLAHMPSDANISGDKVNKYILIYSSHDGSRSITIASTLVRVVCWNTLSASLSSASNKVELRLQKQTGQFNFLRNSSILM